MLYERLQPAWAKEPGAHREDICRFAWEWVEAAEFYRDEEDGAPDYKRELRAILGRLADLKQEREGLAHYVSAAEDFAETPEEEERGRARTQAEAERRGAEIDAERRALGLLFRTMCRALGHFGITFTGQELRKIREGRELTAKQAEALGALHRTKTPTLPAADRLTEEDTATLYEGLTREGLVSGSLQAFAYHLGPLSNGEPIGENSPISWTRRRGWAALFAHFVERFANYSATRQGKTSTPNRTTALCRAFGIDEKQQQSTIEPNLVRGLPARGRETIDKIFRTLPGVSTK